MMKYKLNPKQSKEGKITTMKIWGLYFGYRINQQNECTCILSAMINHERVEKRYHLWGNTSNSTLSNGRDIGIE